MEKMDLTDNYRVSHPIAGDYTFYWTDLGTFSKINHILDYKANLNTQKKFKIIPCILTDHNGIKLEINDKENHRKDSNTRRLNNTHLNDWWITKEIRKEIKKVLESNENEDTIYQNLCDTANEILRWKFITMSAHIRK
jgi:hypothetical protein